MRPSAVIAMIFLSAGCGAPESDQPIELTSSDGKADAVPLSISLGKSHPTAKSFITCNKKSLLGFGSPQPCNVRLDFDFVGGALAILRSKRSPRCTQPSPPKWRTVLRTAARSPQSPSPIAATTLSRSHTRHAGPGRIKTTPRSGLATNLWRLSAFQSPMERPI